MTIGHPILELLIRLGLSTRETIVSYHHRVRDRDDIGVLRCARSGVILLDRIDHCTAGYYENRDTFAYWRSADRAAALKATAADDRRRAEAIRDVVRGRRWLDVGTGAGGICDLLRDSAASVAAVEPQTGARECLIGLGYTVYAAMEEVADGSVDVMTLFHVYEHIPAPLDFLVSAKRKLAPGGLLCIEVPHARDALLTQYDCAAFRDFTLWSEHLVLHTRESLTRFVGEAGFAVRSVQGIQRYPLANHLHWLSRGAPGGHAAWPHLVSSGLDHEYERTLASLDLTDTLVLWARN